MNYREMAERNTIIRSVVGSTVHGLALEGTDDRDEMGICIETLEAFAGFSPFEQYIYRTASEREGKHDAPSQPGDLDLTIYSLRKWLRLAVQGNPTVLTLLYVPQNLCSHVDARGAHLQELAPAIISKQAGKRYLGYMESQRQRLLGERGQKKVNRPDLEEKYGYDTKYAMHLIRLGCQGCELLEIGKLTFPMKDEIRGSIRGIREGKTSFNEVLQWAGDLERDLKDLLDSSPLNDRPNIELVEEWMLNMYWENWKAYRINALFTATRKDINAGPDICITS